ncbi:uncharacterized protein LOC126672129 [Mercurialis annua]|uniref:uncharacterized protein LOC126672129 n=1 Tax=Mercurialis annua TaxID=3986 RepID=UPI002160BA24|nr:uncharacterized protein LOC126672129 [Mercurialis annua]
MASAVSIISPMLLGIPKFGDKEFRLSKVPLVPRIMSRQTTFKTATYLHASYCSNGNMSSVGCCHGYSALIDHFGELVSCCMNVTLWNHEVIIGFWIGPDIDDGWGFVEAFINQIA